jgi:hypothetical protein
MRIVEEPEVARVSEFDRRGVGQRGSVEDRRALEPDFPVEALGLGTGPSDSVVLAADAEGALQEDVAGDVGPLRALCAGHVDGTREERPRTHGQGQDRESEGQDRTGPPPQEHRQNTRRAPAGNPSRRTGFLLS